MNDSEGFRTTVERPLLREQQTCTTEDAHRRCLAFDQSACAFSRIAA
jgi:hypothetical protein